MQPSDTTSDAATLSLNMLGPLINHMLSELSAPRGWWAVGALLVSLAFAVLVRRAMQRRFEGEGKPVGTLTRAWIDRLSGPVIAWVLLLLVRSVLANVVDVTVLEVGAQLVLALLGVRALLLLVEQTFPDTPVINAFERVIAITLWSLAALHLLGLLHVVVDTLDGIAIPMGKSRLSLLQLFTGLCTLMLATVLALWLSRAIDSRLAAISGVDQGVRAVISRVAQPVLLLLSLLIALPVVGIDLTTLSVFGGAVGVGLGFGLQKIAANYISGFIILLDRSIEPGRLIRIDRFRGIVSEIRTRYTVIKGLDGVDSIVPNEMLVNSVVESETFTDSSTRVAVRVGVSYDCDVEQAMQLLIDVATAQDRVMSQPPPRAFLVAFGDSAITLEVGFWIPDPQNGTLLLTSAINLGVYHAYKQAGIGIPVPQREISFKASPADVPGDMPGDMPGNRPGNGPGNGPARFAPPSAPAGAKPTGPYDA